MKAKLIVVMVFVIAISGLVVSTGAEKAADNKCLKIGVVSVRKIFQDCKRNARYKQDITAERDKMEAELDTLSKQIEISKNGLKMLKPGSADYLAGMKIVRAEQEDLRKW